LTSPASERVVVDIEGRPVTLTNLDKVLWPRVEFTKRQMIAYYAAIAPVLIPHLRDRPLTTKRFPDGVEGVFWYQTECFNPPDWVRTIDLPSLTTPGKTYHYCTIDGLASLMWIANTGAVELHPLLFHGTALDVPSAAVFDLDPGPPANVIDSCRTAVLLRATLDGVGLRCFPKTSGGKGVHVFVPLNGPVTYGQAKAFARSVADALAAAEPERVTSVFDKRRRAGKVFIDWRQNNPTNSTVAPYSLRAMDVPSVSMPLSWDEVERAAEEGAIAPLRFLPHEAIDRVEARGDLFEGVLNIQQRLPHAR
jgi:bifunctional non-homologous end joining protein LigD